MVWKDSNLSGRCTLCDRKLSIVLNFCFYSFCDIHRDPFDLSSGTDPYCLSVWKKMHKIV